MFGPGSIDYPSLSGPGSDLEVDNASLIAPGLPRFQPQVKQIPVPQGPQVFTELETFAQQRFDSLEIQKQIRLEEEGRCISGGSKMKHELWRTHVQHQPVSKSEQPESAPVESSAEREIDLGGYTVQLDEIGEG